MGLEPSPHPGYDVLGGGIVENAVEIVVIDFAEDVLAHELLHLDEINGEAGVGIDGPFDEDQELVVMPVGVEAGALVTGQAVGGVELKLDSKNQRPSPPNGRSLSRTRRR